MQVHKLTLFGKPFFEICFCLVRQLTGEKACYRCGAVFETHSNDEWHLENDV